jgi:hypothetical protein
MCSSFYLALSGLKVQEAPHMNKDYSPNRLFSRRRGCDPTVDGKD